MFQAEGRGCAKTLGSAGLGCIWGALRKDRAQGFAGAVFTGCRSLSPFQEHHGPVTLRALFLVLPQPLTANLPLEPHSPALSCNSGQNLSPGG